MTEAEAFALAEPPQDGISSVAFSPTNEALLLVTSWDKVEYILNSRSILEFYMDYV
jgi:hypothetical protein